MFTKFWANIRNEILLLNNNKHNLFLYDITITVVIYKKGPSKLMTLQDFDKDFIL